MTQVCSSRLRRHKGGIVKSLLRPSVPSHLGLFSTGNQCYSVLCVLPEICDHVQPSQQGHHGGQLQGTPFIPLIQPMSPSDATDMDYNGVVALE